MKKMIVSLCAMVLCAGSVSAQYHYQDSTNPEILRHAAYHAPKEKPMPDNVKAFFDKFLKGE